MFAIIAGFLAGWIHVFSGPDHLAAVAPLAVKGRRGSWRTGFSWGVGHSAGVIFIGVLALAFREWLPLDAISSWSERLVGVLLIGVGLWGLRLALDKNLHAHEHAHDGETHVHLHVHSPGESHESAAAHQHNHAAFGIGSLHGLAGSSHFLAVLPALAFSTTAGAASYLAAYGIGTIAAMAIFTGALGMVAGRLAVGGIRAYRGLLSVCAVAAVGIGAYWVIRM